MRVLLVEDDRRVSSFVSRGLSDELHSVTTVETGLEGLEYALTNEFDVIILDLALPEMGGAEVCTSLRNKSIRTPILILSAMKGIDTKVDVLNRGADDYLTKPFHLGELEARLRAGKRIVDLQNELISARETLRLQAMQDPLTQILNHGAILDALLNEINRSQREQQPLSLILADLDGFKAVNDTYGHVAGDQVLIEVARRMRNCLRSYDSIGRYGGEEFLVVLPNSDESQALGLAERIRVAISSEPFRFSHVDLTVTVSQGVTTWMDPDSIPIERLIQSADRALYGVKHSGRNAVQHVEFDQDAEEAFSPMFVSPISGDP